MLKQILLHVLLRPAALSNRFSQNRTEQHQRPKRAIGATYGEGNLPRGLAYHGIGQNRHDFFWCTAGHRGNHIATRIASNRDGVIRRVEPHLYTGWTPADGFQYLFIFCRDYPPRIAKRCFIVFVQ